MSTTTPPRPSQTRAPSPQGGHRSAALPSGLRTDPVGTWAGRRVRGAFADLRFVSVRPPSLLEHLAYARRGEWTEEIDGARRHAALVFAWLVAVPVSTVAYLAVWAAARPSRFFSALVVALLVANALAQVPAVGWLIPGWVKL